MPENFAENRKPCQLEGGPVIHQGMTVQLFVPVLHAGVTVQGSFLPSPLPRLAQQSRAGLDFVLSPLEAAWPDSVRAKFLFIFPGFFGVGRLRNVECCNIGKGGGETGAGSPALLILLTPAPVEAPGSPQLPRPLAKPSSISHCLPAAPWAWPCGPGHTSSLGSGCGFQLLEAAVVASSKQGYGSAADGTRGAIYSRVALGPGAGPRAWGGSAAPHQGPVKRRRMKCGVSAFLWVGSFGTARFGS